MFHSPADHRGYDILAAAHADHLVVFDADPEFLYDPVHHYLFDVPPSGDASASSDAPGGPSR